MSEKDMKKNTIEQALKKIPIRCVTCGFFLRRLHILRDRNRIISNKCCAKYFIDFNEIE